MRVIFDAICFLLALYMTAKMIGRYHEDANAIEIAYKKYSRTREDKYPSFSVCLEGDGLYRFNDTYIFSAYGIHITDFKICLLYTSPSPRDVEESRMPSSA